MFSELPKLFDRNFAMAFFLPVMVALWAAFEMLSRFGLTVNLIAFMQVDLVVRTVIVFLLAWLIGILLVAANQAIYRFLEGYESWNPLSWFRGFEARRFERLLKRIDELNRKYLEAEEQGLEFPFALQSKRNDLMTIYAKYYPHSAEYLLPTPFGNTIRSFEVYSTVMYGLEAIDGWSRLLAVTPADYRALMEDAKSRVDFWVNVGFLSLALLGAYIVLSISLQVPPVWWLLGGLAVSSAVSPGFARGAAVEWGDYVKAAFDIFRPRLREALGFEVPRNSQQEVDQWTRFSQAIVFRLPQVMPGQDHNRFLREAEARLQGGLTNKPIVPAPAPPRKKKRIAR